MLTYFKVAEGRIRKGRTHPDALADTPRAAARVRFTPRPEATTPVVTDGCPLPACSVGCCRTPVVTTGAGGPGRSMLEELPPLTRSPLSPLPTSSSDAGVASLPVTEKGRFDQKGRYEKATVPFCDT